MFGEGMVVGLEVFVDGPFDENVPIKRIFDHLILHFSINLIQLINNRLIFLATGFNSGKGVHITQTTLVKADC